MLTITIKKSDNCWLAKFSDEPNPEFAPTSYREGAPVEKVIKALSDYPANHGAKFVIEE